MISDAGAMAKRGGVQVGRGIGGGWKQEEDSHFSAVGKVKV